MPQPASLTRPVLPNLVVGLGLFLLLLGGWLVWDMQRMRHSILVDHTELALQRSQVIGLTLSKTLLAADLVLRDAIGRISPQDLTYPHPDQRHMQRISHMLREKVQTVPGMYSLAVYDSECTFVANARNFNLGHRSPPSVCQARRAHSNEGAHFQYLAGEQSASGRAVLVISRNVRSAQGEFLGGVLGVIELSHLQQWVGALDVRQHDSVAVLDTQGVLLARAPPLPQQVGQRVQSEGFQDVFLQTAPSAVRVAPSPLDGQTRVFALNRIDPFPIWVAVGLDQSHALQDWRRHVGQFGLGYLGLLGLGWALARAHVRGLRQRTQLLASRRLTLAVINAMPQQIAVLDARGVIVEVNQAWTDFSQSNSPQPGQSAAHTDVGTNYLDICRGAEVGDPVDLAQAQQAHEGIASVLQGQRNLFTLEYPCHSPTEQRWFSMTVTPLPQASGAVVVHTNITQRHLAEDQVRDLAHHDSLTGLPNRRLLLDRLAQVLLECQRTGHHAALLAIDLDHFKPLNDLHGHAAGDHLLIEVGQRLRLGLRAMDTAARVGGDEFVVVLGGLDVQPQAAHEQAMAVAEKIRHTLAEPYQLWPQGPSGVALNHTCTASLGIVLLDGAVTDAGALLDQADQSLYRAKSGGRNAVRAA